MRIFNDGSNFLKEERDPFSGMQEQEVADAFQSILLQKILSSNPQSIFPSSGANGFWQDFFYEKIAEELAKTDALHVREVILEQLK